MNNVKGKCWNNYDTKNFTIDRNTLTINIDCDFPHAIQGLSPDSDIKLPVKQIEEYLNKKYKSLIK